MSSIWFSLHQLPDLSQSTYSALPHAAPDALLAQFEPSLRMLHRLCGSYGLQLRMVIRAEPARPAGQRLQLALGFEGEAHILGAAPLWATWLATPVAPYFAPLMQQDDKGPLDDATPAALGLKGCEVTRMEHYWPLAELGDDAFVRHSELPDWLHAVYLWEGNDSGRLISVLQLMQALGSPCALTLALTPCEGESEYIALHPLYASSLSRLSGGSYKDALGRTDFVKAGPVAEQLRSLRQDLLDRLRCQPCFSLQLRCYAPTRDTARLLADTVMAEAVSEGPHACWPLPVDLAFFEPAPVGIVSLKPPPDVGLPAALQRMPRLFALSEVASLFRLPVLYEGEQLDLRKETWPSLPVHERHQVLLGHTLAAGAQEGDPVYLPLDAMVKHALVVGVPGSGKTNTLMSLARQVWVDHQVPFLVLEPAKREYRGLLNLPGLSGQVLLFAPGRSAPAEWLLEERFNPLALSINPFEMPQGYSVAEHSAQLLQIFKAAFGLWNPLPSLVSDAIAQVYGELGWQAGDLATAQRIARYGFPTMRRFVEVVYAQASATSYQGENAATVKAYLEYQIGSLVAPALGSVFDCTTSTLRPEDWLHRPAIVELESLGEANANFVSLLLQTYLRQTLTVLQETERQTQNQQAKAHKLRHLLFLEEAHNLIGPQAYIPDEKSPDPKAAATAFVVKLLAEVRALGLGIVIGDQLPSALAPEVLKNTSIRICHRLSAPDDRGQMQQSMNASALQFEHMATQTSGQALASWEGVRKPFAMKVLATDGTLARHDRAFSDRAMLLGICQPSEQAPLDLRVMANAVELYARVEAELIPAPYPWEKEHTVSGITQQLLALPEDSATLPAPGECMQGWLFPTEAYAMPPEWVASQALALADVMVDAMGERYRCAEPMLRWWLLRLELPGLSAQEVDQLTQNVQILQQYVQGMRERIQNLLQAMAHAGRALVQCGQAQSGVWTPQNLDLAILVLRLAATMPIPAPAVTADGGQAPSATPSFAHLGLIPDAMQAQLSLHKLLAVLETMAVDGEQSGLFVPSFLRGPLRGVLALALEMPTKRPQPADQRTRQRVQAYLQLLKEHAA